MPNLYVILEGGFVTGICSNDPAALAAVNVSVIDYDTQGCADSSLVTVIGPDGREARARHSGLDIEQAQIRFKLPALVPSDAA